MFTLIQKIIKLDNPKKLLMARFDSPQSLYAVAHQLKAANYTYWDVFASFPIHGMDSAMGLKRSKIPFFTLMGGVTGLVTGIAMVYYMNAYDYALIVGGKPFFSPIFPFPIFYELTILLGAFATLGGMFLMNQLPRYNHPVFEHPSFERASDDAFFVYVDAEDPMFEDTSTRQLLMNAGGTELEFIES